MFFVALSVPNSSSMLVNGSVSQSDEYARVVIQLYDGLVVSNMVILQAGIRCRRSAELLTAACL